MAPIPPDPEFRPVEPWARLLHRPGGRDKRDDEEIVRVWYSDRNFDRRDRAIELARKLGRHPIHIALAYVIAQPFPVIPLIGPRTIAELEDSLSSLDIKLTAEQVKWLEA